MSRVLSLGRLKVQIQIITAVVEIVEVWGWELGDQTMGSVKFQNWN